MREEKKNRHLSKSDPGETRRGAAWDAKEGDVSGSQRPLSLSLSLGPSLSGFHVFTSVQYTLLRS